MRPFYQYVEFVWVKDKPKTSVWNCVNRASGVVLGTVKWYTTWRQYCYFPSAQAVYSASCLADIRDFIGQLMAQRKRRLAGEQLPAVIIPNDHSMED